MDDNLFDLGMDSLTAFPTWNGNQRRVKSSESLGPNVVFENPTPSALARHLWAHTSGAVLDSVNYYEEAMRMAGQGKTMTSPCKARDGPTETVLLSGSTGSIGVHVLQQLVQNHGIKKVLCPVRATSDVRATERVEQSLHQRKLPSIRDLQANGSKTECFASDLSFSTLGLASDVFDRVKTEIDITIHAAWPVDFNLPLSSFAPHITATINLLNQTLESRFTFLSSVSAASRWRGAGAVPKPFFATTKWPRTWVTHYRNG